MPSETKQTNCHIPPGFEPGTPCTLDMYSTTAPWEQERGQVKEVPVTRKTIGKPLSFFFVVVVKYFIGRPNTIRVSALQSMQRELDACMSKKDL